MESRESTLTTDAEEYVLNAEGAMNRVVTRLTAFYHQGAFSGATGVSAEEIRTLIAEARFVEESCAVAHERLRDWNAHPVADKERSNDSLDSISDEE